jgi:hypothetical protein
MVIGCRVTPFSDHVLAVVPVAVLCSTCAVIAIAGNATAATPVERVPGCCSAVRPIAVISVQKPENRPTAYASAPIEIGDAGGA